MKTYRTLKIVLILWFKLIVSSGSSAQVIPDSSLPQDSRVIREGNTIIIEGGTKKGSNLFHSLRKFSLRQFETVILNNPAVSENVFLRVTGDSPSFIDGTLRSLGNANLFLLNRNGISFGKNAILEVGGDFMATTASSIIFADGSKFLSLRQSQENNLLSVSRPIGLEMFENSGSIDVNNVGHQLRGFTNPFTSLNLEENPLGLSVSSGNSIIFVGNGVNFEGGIVTAKSGQVEIWSIQNGSLNLLVSNSSYRVTPNNVAEWGNILLNNRSLLDASSFPGGNNNSGDISLYGKTIELNLASVIISQNESAEARGGNIKLFGSDSIVLRGVSPSETAISSNLVISSTLGNGQGGNIEVDTLALSIFDGSRLGTRSYGIGSSGDIRIKAENINLEGVSSLNPFLTSAITSNALSEGSSGSIYIISNNIKITGGAVIGSVTLNQGNGGNVSVTAETIFLRGNSPILAPSSISGTTFNQGRGGNLVLDAEKIYVYDGAAITTSSLGLGDGGDISIKAQELIVSGSNNSVDGRVIVSGISSSVIIPIEFENDFFQLNQISNQPSSGSIRIEADKFYVDRAIISVGNAGFGLGGEIYINANEFFLQGGEVSALSFAGQGGNTSLNLKKLVLNDGALINASAGEQGNGGNVNINGGITILFDESNIIANAIKGNGGNIKISVDGFFASFQSLISASSQFGLDGNVEIDSDISNLRRIFLMPRIALEPAEKMLEESCEVKFFGDRLNRFSLREFPQSNNLINYGDFISLTVIEIPFLMQYIPEDTELQTEETKDLPIPATTIAMMSDGTLVLVNEARLASQNFPQFPKRPDFCRKRDVSK
ncbi:MAG: filamentous hemagglutinin N-terminal domain-containing protein [Gloeocapsa sp. DLM2.Bin57]|nr:MAG: filamentous hemagglutinin N-terminal domain-containing protein [Gloeocapsa sp. DLM2.Bin57]